MAQRVNIVLVDDIDGSDATQTVAFGTDLQTVSSVIIVLDNDDRRAGPASPRLNLGDAHCSSPSCWAARRAPARSSASRCSAASRSRSSSSI